MFNYQSLRLLSCGALLAGALCAQARTGMQPVGFSAFAPSDVTKMTEVFRSCPANQACELAFLAYSFGGFTNAGNFIKTVVPAMSGTQKLVIGIYLDDGANRDGNAAWCYFKKGTTARTFWDRVRANDATMMRDWQNDMAKPAAAFIREMQSWASGRKLSARLSFVVIPVLEDGGPSGADPAGAAGYSRLLSWTKTAMPTGVTYRRSSTAKSPDRALPLEWHDKTLPGSFRASDVITPDGVTVSDDTWRDTQRKAIAKSGSGLWWISSFNNNGTTRTSPPWERGALKPFTNDAGLLSRAKSIIGTRR